MYVSKSGLALVWEAQLKNTSALKNNQITRWKLVNWWTATITGQNLISCFFLNHFLDLISDDKNKVLPIFNIIQPRYPHICNYNSDCIEQRVASLVFQDRFWYSAFNCLVMFIPPPVQEDSSNVTAVLPDVRHQMAPLSMWTPAVTGRLWRKAVSSGCEAVCTADRLQWTPTRARLLAGRNYFILLSCTDQHLTVFISYSSWPTLHHGAF